MHDTQHAAVHAAQEEAEWASADEGIGDDLAPDEVSDFIAGALAAAGWTAESAPLVVYDVPDDHELSGWVDQEGSIHLHPRLVGRWTVLHELAHWLDPRGGRRRRRCCSAKPSFVLESR